LEKGGLGEILKEYGRPIMDFLVIDRLGLIFSPPRIQLWPFLGDIRLIVVLIHGSMKLSFI
jgi:hypothetical protein